VVVVYTKGAISFMMRTSTFNDICFDQNAELYFYSISSLKQHITGRHAAPL